MVEFQGKLNGEVVNRLNKRQFKKIWWFFLIFPLIIVGAGVFFVVFPEDRGDLVTGVVLISFGVVFPVLLVALTKFSQKKANKNMSLISDNTFETFQFYPDKLVIVTRKGEEYEGITTAKYSYLYKVEETPDAYFLSISQTQFHVVMKADLTQGTLEELNSILYANLGASFIRSK